MGWTCRWNGGDGE